MCYELKMIFIVNVPIYYFTLSKSKNNKNLSLVNYDGDASDLYKAKLYWRTDGRTEGHKGL